MIRSLLNLYVLVLIIDVILSYLPQFKGHPVAQFVKKAADFTCRPIRQVMPPDLPFDFSPMVVIIIIQVLKVLW